MRYCKARRGVVWPGMVWFGFSGEKFLFGKVWCGTAGWGRVRHGGVGSGEVRSGVVRSGFSGEKFLSGSAWQGLAWWGVVRSGEAWQVLVR